MRLLHKPLDSMKEELIDIIARELAIHLFMSCSSDVRQERTLLEHEAARFLRREYGFLDKAEDRDWTSVKDGSPEVKAIDGAYLIPKGRCYMSKPVLVKKDYPNIGEEFRYEIARFCTYDDGAPDWTCGGGVVAWMEIPE